MDENFEGHVVTAQNDCVKMKKSLSGFQQTILSNPSDLQSTDMPLQASPYVISYKLMKD